jgi:AraC-like DNA-binding protein
MNSNRIKRERAGTTRRKQQLLEDIFAYVDANLTQRINLQQVAAHFNVSVSTVTQLFQHKADMTFHQLLNQRRMEVADQLISEGVPLEEVGKKIGYADHSSFYRAFKQHYGVSPREYKQGKTE